MAGELILVIEDDELSRKLFRDLLRLEGYATIETRMAADGLELARQRLPSLVLLDIRLPDMDGVTALRQLRRMPETRHLPVIAVTASVMPVERSQVISAGFDGFLVKPLDIDRLIEEVRSTLASKGGGKAG